MQQYERRGNSGRSAFNRGSDLIATTSGVVATAAIGPLMYAESIGVIRDYATDHYPWLWDGGVTLFWAVISGLFTFALTTLRIIWACKRFIYRRS